MSHLNLAVLPQTMSQEESDLISIAPLLRLLPSSLSPWEDALGIQGYKQIAVRLNRCLDRLLPGLIAFPIPTSQSSLTVVASYNFYDYDRVASEVSKFALHSPKLTFADADKDAVVPYDLCESFPYSKNLIGAHTLSSADALDYYSGASNAALFKQTRHIVRNGGMYVLPNCISLADLSDACAEHLKMMQKIVASDVLHKNREISTIAGLPQVLIPDSDASNGYISITPLACGGVIAALASAVKEFSVSQYETQPDPAQRKNILRSAFLPAVSNKQNLSGLIGPSKYVLLSASPLVDSEARKAFTLSTNDTMWIRNELRKLRFSRTEPSFRFAVRILKEQIVDVLSRADDDEVINTTTSNERRHELNSVRYLARPLVSRILLTSREYEDMLSQTIYGYDTFDVEKVSLAVLSGLIDLIGIALSGHTLSAWLKAIQVEIHEQMAVGTEF